MKAGLKSDVEVALNIAGAHVAEALQCRCFDWGYECLGQPDGKSLHLQIVHTTLPDVQYNRSSVVLGFR